MTFIACATLTDLLFAQKGFPDLLKKCDPLRGTKVTKIVRMLQIEQTHTIPSIASFNCQLHRLKNRHNPLPSPIHIVTSAYLPPVRRSSYSAFTTSIQPVAPMG